jgi:hypothetical protein
MKTFWCIGSVILDQVDNNKFIISCTNREKETKVAKIDSEQFIGLFDYYYGLWKSSRVTLSSQWRSDIDYAIVGKTFPGEGDLEKDLENLFHRIPETQDYDNKQTKVWKFINFRQIPENRYSVDIQCVGYWDITVTFKAEQKAIEERLTAFFGFQTVVGLESNAVLEMPFFNEDQKDELWQYLDNLMKESGF